MRAALVLLAAFASFVHAQGKPAALPAAAQEALNKGVMAAKVPDYLLAIRFFEDARKIAPENPLVFLNLGLAESRIPGRELRAIAWFSAYLAAYPAAANAAAVRQQIEALDIKSQSNISRLIKSVQDAAAQLPSAADRDDSLVQVAELWAMAGDTSGALKVTEMIGVPPGILTDLRKGRALIAVARYQAIYGDIAGAHRSADSIRHTAYKSQAQRVIAEVQLAAGDAEGARSSLSAAHATAVLIKNDVHALGSELSDIAKIQAKAGDIPGALKSIDLAPAGLSKSYALYDIAVAQAKAGDIAGALITAERIQTDSKRSAQAEIAKAQVSAGDLEGAKKTIDLLPEGLGKAQVQHPLGLGQVKAGDLTGALRTAAQIQDLSYRGYVLAAVAKAQVQRKDFPAALKTADLMKESDARSARWDVLKAQLDGGDVAAAQRTATLIQQPLWKVFVQTSIADAQFKGGDAAAARRTLAAAEGAYDVLKGEDRNTARKDIAATQARFGDVPGALASIDSLPESEQDSSRAAIASAQAGAGDIAGALHTADLAQSEYWKGWGRVWVADQQIKKGDLAGARKTLAEAQKAGDLYVETNPRNPKKNLLQAIAERRPKAAGGPAAPATQPAVRVSDWIAQLEATTGYAPLSTAPFLDLPGYLRSLPTSSSAKNSFDALRQATDKLITAHNVIDRMLKQQKI